MKSKSILLCRSFLILALVAAIGCNSATDPGSKNVLFEQVEGAVGDMQTNVSGKHYSGDLGDDRMGPILTNFQKSVAGTALEADVDKLVKKFTEVSTLASKRPKIDALRKSVQELADIVAEVKKKL